MVWRNGQCGWQFKPVAAAIVTRSRLWTQVASRPWWHAACGKDLDAWTPESWRGFILADKQSWHRERLQAGGVVQQMAPEMGARRDSTRTPENLGGCLAGLSLPYPSRSPTRFRGHAHS
jgi:hypothetical protein